MIYSGVKLGEIGKLHQNKTSRPKLSVDAAEIRRLHLVDIYEILEMFHVNFVAKNTKQNFGPSTTPNFKAMLSSEKWCPFCMSVCIKKS